MDSVRDVSDELYEECLGDAVVLRDVADHLDDERVLVGEGALHQHPQPAPLADQLRVPLVGGEVDGERHDLEVDLLLAALEDGAHEHGDGVGVGEHGLDLVLHAEVVQHARHRVLVGRV